MDFQEQNRAETRRTLATCGIEGPTPTALPQTAITYSHSAAAVTQRFIIKGASYSNPNRSLREKQESFCAKPMVLRLKMELF